MRKRLAAGRERTHGGRGACRAPYNLRTIFGRAGMSIKSDRWIRRMAKEHGMIEPFELGQVRQATDANGKETRIVSYGT